MSMDALKQFSIPIKGLKTGFSEYDFKIEKAFFEQFEDTLIQSGNVDAHFSIEKRPDFFELVFEISGTVKADCDRCLKEIDLPISSEERLLLKYSEQEAEEELDVIYITSDQTYFNIAKYIYEFISLAVPMVKVFDCQQKEPFPCDQEMLNRLKIPDQSETGKSENPTWDALKDIKF